MSKKSKRDSSKIGRRNWIPKKWRIPAMAVLVISILYVVFLGISAILNGKGTDAYVEVFVGEWMKSINDSRTLPVVFDVIPKTTPTSPVVNLPIENTISLNRGIRALKYEPHCGLPKSCPSGEFSIHVYTGKDHSDHPKLCVDGKYVMDGGTVGGRGINIAVIDILTKNVIDVKTFDTYEKDSTKLETLLLTLRPGDIIVMLTFDEPTKKLSRIARLLFHELGSSMAQNLQYRAGWYLITQKGMTGFSPYEGLNLIDSDGWPKAHDQRFCVPFQLSGQKIHPDPLPRLNPRRMDFCHRHPVFPNFCNGDVVNDVFYTTAPLKSAASNTDIYKIPIVVMSGLNVNYLPTTLETLVRQPGVNPKIVVIYFLPQHPEVAELSDLFGFMSEELTCNKSPCDQALEAFSTTWNLFPDAPALLYIEENVVLSPDFLSYLGQLLHLLKLDPSLDAISAFNDNGFSGVSGDPALVHRVEHNSAVALLVRKNALNISSCTDRKERGQWLSEGLPLNGDTLIPDLSRAVFIPSTNSKDEKLRLYSEAIMNRKRETSLFSDIRIPNLNFLVKEEYEKELTSDLLKSREYQPDMDDLDKCNIVNEAEDTTQGMMILAPELRKLNTTGQILAFHLEQGNNDDYSVWAKILTCFGLFFHPSLPFPHNYYNGTVRFSWESNKVYIVSSLSRFSVLQNGRNASHIFIGQMNI